MADLVAVPPGNYTPGALAALQFPASLINAAWSQANIKFTGFETKVANLDTFLGSNPVANITAEVVPTTGVLEPVVSIPATVDASSVMTLFDTKYTELVALLADKFTAFRNNHFPSEQATYAAAESWISAALANPDGAIPASVAAQILTEDSDRAYAEAAVLSDNVLATFAARRFPLPPGAAASAVLQINQKVQDVVADSSRKLVMGYIEQMRFAVEKAMNLRQTAMAAAVEYIKALASGPDMASRLVGTGYDAQSKLISSAAQFYNARTGAMEMVHKAEQFNATTKLTVDTKNQAVSLDIVEKRVQALLAEAQAIAQMAASLYNNLHASAGTTYNVTGT